MRYYGSITINGEPLEAVGDDLCVLFDSGVRSGPDVFKALALGAEAVLLGRPYLYGLALGGQPGVEHVLRCLLAELDLQKARLRSVQLELRAAVAAIELRRASGGDVVSFNIKTTTQKQ